MGGLHDFLMVDHIAQERLADVTIKPFPAPFRIKSITEAENQAILKSCQRTEIDKRTHQRHVITDMPSYHAKLIAACCVDPNFRDAQLQARYGVVGEVALIGRLLNIGQHDKLLAAVYEVNNVDNDINDLVEEVKNSSAAETESPPSHTPPSSEPDFSHHS